MMLEISMVSRRPLNSLTIRVMKLRIIQLYHYLVTQTQAIFIEILNEFLSSN